jgi:dTDP-4-dehydrorhamnose reductase
LLLGKNGQAGWELHRTLISLGDLTAIDYPEIDMADPSSIIQVVSTVNPDIIVNATAYTNVDKAETDAGLAMAVNAEGPGILAKETAKRKGILIHYSTDYVFNGLKEEPYTEDDTPDPLNVYGKSKLAGEAAVQDMGLGYLIFRTSWVYSLRRPCFVTKVLQWPRENEVLKIVDDQVSTPTWSRTLGEVTAQVIAQGRIDPVNYLKEKTGLYHLTDSGSCSRYEWARLILENAPGKQNLITKEIYPVKSDAFETAALRPKRTVLDGKKFVETFVIIPPDWKQSTKLMLEESSER